MYTTVSEESRSSGHLRGGAAEKSKSGEYKEHSLVGGLSVANLRPEARSFSQLVSGRSSRRVANRSFHRVTRVRPVMRKFGLCRFYDD